MKRGVRTVAAIITIVGIIAGLAFAPAPVRALSTSGDEPTIALEKACAYLAGRDFTAESTGTVKARVFGVPYTQKLTGSRVVTGGAVVETVETSSAFVNAAVKKTAGGGKYTACTGKKKKSSFVYDAPVEYTEEDFIAKFGKPFTGLIKYELDGAVASSRKIADGEYEYELDPSRAALYAKNEVRTTLGIKSFPEYYSISFVLVTDGDRPVEVTVREKFKVDKFGGTTCAAEYKERFYF